MNKDAAERQSFSEWIKEPQSLIGLSAVLLSLCGLGIALYEASLIREAQRSSVWPHVQVTWSNEENSVRLHARNSGVGPARVEAAAVRYRGKTLLGWRGLVDSLLAKEDESRPQESDSLQPDFAMSIITGRVLPPDSPWEFLMEISTGKSSTEATAATLLHRAAVEGDVEVSLCYCSVYDECWISSLQDMLRQLRGEELTGGSGKVDNCNSTERSEI